MSEDKEVTIPGVRSRAITEVRVLRLDVRYDGVMETYEMLDGSRKILITSSTQPYIEITAPATKEAT